MSNEIIQETFENNIDDSYSEKGKDPDELSEPGGMREEIEAYEAARKRKAEREQNAQAGKRQKKLITGENDELDIANDSFFKQPQEERSEIKAPDTEICR